MYCTIVWYLRRLVRYDTLAPEVSRRKALTRMAVAEDVSERETEESGPPSRPQRAPDEAFFPTINSFSPAHQERLSFYVYQLQPVVDLTKSGTAPKYRTVFDRPFTEEQLKTECGSGVYQIRVNERNDKGKQHTILTHTVEIYDVNCPPKLPYGPWVEDERNARWIWGHKKELPAASGPAAQNGNQFSPEFLTAFATAVDKLRPNQIKTDDSATVLKTVLDASRQGGEQTYQMMKSHFEANDPGKFLESVKTVLEIAMPKKPEGSDPMIALLMQELKSAREAQAAAQKANNDLLLKMLEQAKAEPGKGIVEQITVFAQAFSSLQENFGGGSVKTGVLDLIKELGTPVVQALAPVGGLFLQHQMAKSWAQPTPQPGTQAGRPMPPATPQSAPQVNPPQNPSTPEPVAAKPTDDPQIVAMMNLAQWTANALAMRMEGSVFAEEVVVKNMGELTYDQICSAPKEQLLAMMHAYPPAWALLAPYETQLPQFLDEFYGWGQTEESPAAVPPIENATAKPKRGTKKGLVQ